MEKYVEHTLRDYVMGGPSDDPAYNSVMMDKVSKNIAILRARWKAGKLAADDGDSAAEEFLEFHDMLKPRDKFKTEEDYRKYVNKTIDDVKKVYADPDYVIKWSDDQNGFVWGNKKNVGEGEYVRSTPDLISYLERSGKFANGAIERAASEMFSRMLPQEAKNVGRKWSERLRKDPLFHEGYNIPGDDNGFNKAGWDLLGLPRTGATVSNDEYASKRGSYLKAVGGDVVESIPMVAATAMLSGIPKTASAVGKLSTELLNAGKNASRLATGAAGSYLAGQGYDAAVPNTPFENREFSGRDLALQTAIGGVGGGILGPKFRPTTKSQARRMVYERYKNGTDWKSEFDVPDDLVDAAMKGVTGKEYTFGNLNEFSDKPFVAERSAPTVVADGKRLELKTYPNREEIITTEKGTPVIRTGTEDLTDQDILRKVKAGEVEGVQMPERVDIPPTENELIALERLNTAQTTRGDKRTSLALAKEQDRRNKIDSDAIRKARESQVRSVVMNEDHSPVWTIPVRSTEESSKVIDELTKLREDAVAAGKSTLRIDIAIARERQRVLERNEDMYTRKLKAAADAAVDNDVMLSPKSNLEKQLELQNLRVDEDKIARLRSQIASLQSKRELLGEKEYQKQLKATVEKARAEISSPEYVYPNTETTRQWMNEQGLKGNVEGFQEVLREAQYQGSDPNKIIYGVNGENWRGTGRDVNKMLSNYSTKKSKFNPDYVGSNEEFGELLRTKVVPEDPLLRIPYKKARTESGRKRKIIGEKEAYSEQPLVDSEFPQKVRNIARGVKKGDSRIGKLAKSALARGVVSLLPNIEEGYNSFRGENPRVIYGFTDWRIPKSGNN